MTDDTLVLTKLEANKRHVLGLKGIERVGTAIKLPIADIAVGERLIPEEPIVVSQLVISIKNTRQLTPILVRRTSAGYMLVDGLNRIAALKQLGEAEVLASLLVVTSEEEARACEAISNSHRRQKLAALDRALTDVAFLEYVQKKVAQDAAPRGGKQPREKYQAKTARELGVTVDQIARSCKIAKIQPYVQQAIRRRKLEDNQRLLLEVAASGDDVMAQVHTLARLMPRVDKAEVDQATEQAPVNQSENQACPRPPSGSGSPEKTISQDCETAGRAQSPDLLTRTQEDPRPASPSSRVQPTRDQPSTSRFDAIKEEWGAAAALRRVLRESSENDRKRFLDECVMPEVFPTVTVEQSEDDGT